jgi:hypothetical protein
MNLIGVDVSLTGWSCKYLSEMVVNCFFFQATTILILVCTALNFQSANLHPSRISSSLAFIAG